MNLSELKSYGIDPGQAHRIVRSQEDLCKCGQRKNLTPDRTQDSKVDRFEDEKRIFLQCWFPLVGLSDECFNCRMLRRRKIIEELIEEKHLKYSQLDS